MGKNRRILSRLAIRPAVGSVGRPGADLRENRKRFPDHHRRHAGHRVQGAFPGREGLWRHHHTILRLCLRSGLCRHHAPTYDEWIKTSDVFDAIFDFDAVAHNPAYPARNKSDIEAPDHIHLNPKGYQAVADSVPLSGHDPKLPK